MTLRPKFHELLLEGARSLNAEVTDGPTEWTGSAFNAEVLSSGVERRVFHRHENDLPTKVAAFRIDGTPLLIGELSAPPSAPLVDDQLRRYRNQASIARSWLAAEGPNLQLFLIGPEGALAQRGWFQLAASIEADDRICRKLVWLFAGTPTPDSAALFLERTFAATPWAKEERVRAQLDQMADVGLSAGWQAVVDDEELDAESLVNKLVELEGGEA